MGKHGKLKHIGKEEMARIIEDYKAGKSGTWSDIATGLGVEVSTLRNHRIKLGFTEAFPTGGARPAADGGVAVTIVKAKHRTKKSKGRPPVWREVGEMVVGLTIKAVRTMDDSVVLITGKGGIRISGNNIVMSIVNGDELATWSRRVYAEYKKREEEFALAKMLQGDSSPMIDGPVPTVANGAADVQR